MQFDALEKSVMGQQIRAFNNCNKWTPPAYKHYWRWKSSYFELMAILQLKNTLTKTEIPLSIQKTMVHR